MFSVVIPLYNKEAYIARSITSVLSQTFGGFELLVVDDGSTDGSFQAASGITDSRLRVLQKENGGEASARNFGIRNSSHDYIAFLDADDEWRPGFLETVRGLIEKYPEASTYSTAYAIVGEGGVFEPRFMPEQDCLVRDYYRFAARQSSITSSSVAVKRQVFEDVGLFNEGLRFGPDLEMWFRIHTKYCSAFSSTVGALWHTEAQGRVCAEKRVFDDQFLLALDRVRLDHAGSALAPSMRVYIYASFKVKCIELLIAGDNGQARTKVLEYAKRGIVTVPEALSLLTLTFLPIKHIMTVKKRLGR